MGLRGRQDVLGARPGGDVLDVAAQVEELVFPALHPEFGGDPGVVAFGRSCDGPVVRRCCLQPAGLVVVRVALRDLGLGREVYGAVGGGIEEELPEAARLLWAFVVSVVVGTAEGEGVTGAGAGDVEEPALFLAGSAGEGCFQGGCVCVVVGFRGVGLRVDLQRRREGLGRGEG